MFVQLRGSLVIPLPEPTADSRVLAAYAIRGLKHMYRPGFEYKKAAVMLSELQPEGQRQACLWDDEADEVGREDAQVEAHHHPVFDSEGGFLAFVSQDVLCQVGSRPASQQTQQVQPALRDAPLAQFRGGLVVHVHDVRPAAEGQIAQQHVVMNSPAERGPGVEHSKNGKAHQSQRWPRCSSGGRTGTLAAEAGLLDTDKWVKQLFADLEDFEYFLNELSQYNDSYTIFDRWWHAFSQLAYGKDSAGFSTSKEIAAGLYKHASETGQI